MNVRVGSLVKHSYTDVLLFGVVVSIDLEKFVVIWASRVKITYSSALAHFYMAVQVF